MDRHQLFLVDERIKTFKTWPFSDKEKCNSWNMAEAGFYSMATGSDDADAAKCFLCGKEMDGWEASDDPWAEHASHAPHKCGSPLFQLLEFLSVVKQYMINEVKRVAEVAKDKVDERVKPIIRRCHRKK
ncbi:Apoptosis inhibitor survivin [Operophtera brumata]|uniref:Apoptosis inhibitor survivin n=1 Tax=Operophtera brumata TaxID=104452 RepID=A0A0L7L1J9_OPEBR|nr:Apoptosis inhibitor survivin [Operophtera brumata]